ncbi:MAG TPA: hypothetical protein VNH64_06185, partial [Parvularculaceae bacterium]|nr:hypothetical protein [Parvularculaceae bacterium]
DTFRWRMMAAAYFEGANAARLDVNIQSLSDRKKIVRFLIDDVAAIKEGCVAPVDVAAGRPAKAATPVAPDLEPASGS